MLTVFEGGCLCGAVRYKSSAAPLICAHCHCEDCRRTSGTGHGSHLAVPAEAFSITGEVKFYDRPADSGHIVSRAFCPNCGSAVYSGNREMGTFVFIRASSLDDLEVFKPMAVVYTKRAASWDRQDPTLPSFEEMPPPEVRQKMLEG